MKYKTINLLVILIFISNSYFVVFAETTKTVKQKTAKSTNEKQFNMIEKKQPVVPDVSFGSDEPQSQKEELIQVSVKNEFDEEVKVKFDTNREYPIGPHESIVLGQRKPGKYTLTIYNKKGEFVDNLTRNIDNRNKFILNKNIVSNSDKITGLTTGQKVAIGAGALGAAALGGALINKALQENNQVGEGFKPAPALQNPLFPPSTQQQEIIPEQNQLPVEVGLVREGFKPSPITPTQDQNQPIEPIPQNNAFVANGMSIKILNTKYPQVTLIVEGADGNPIGDNWVIPLAAADRKPQPLVFNSEKITINPNQKIKITLQEGFQLQRYGFELEVDPVDDSYVWVFSFCVDNLRHDAKYVILLGPNSLLLPLDDDFVFSNHVVVLFSGAPFLVLPDVLPRVPWFLR